MGNGWSLRSKFSHQEKHRWHKGGVGMFARKVGNLLQAFSCVPRVAPIMEMDSCFSEVPVWVDGSVQFIDVKTLVLKVHGVQEPCNDLLPLTVQAVESWVDSCQISTHGDTPERRNIRSSNL